MKILPLLDLGKCETIGRGIFSNSPKFEVDQGQIWKKQLQRQRCVIISKKFSLQRCLYRDSAISPFVKRFFQVTTPISM